MRKERKLGLMIPPEIPKKYMDMMQGRYAANFVVLVTWGAGAVRPLLSQIQQG